MSISVNFTSDELGKLLGEGLGVLPLPIDDISRQNGITYSRRRKTVFQKVAVFEKMQSERFSSQPRGVKSQSLPGRVSVRRLIKEQEKEKQTRGGRTRNLPGRLSGDQLIIKRNLEEFFRNRDRLQKTASDSRLITSGTERVKQSQKTSIFSRRSKEKEEVRDYLALLSYREMDRIVGAKKLIDSLHRKRNLITAAFARKKLENFRNEKEHYEAVMAVREKLVKIQCQGAMLTGADRERRDSLVRHLIVMDPRSVSRTKVSARKMSTIINVDDKLVWIKTKAPNPYIPERT